MAKYQLLLPKMGESVAEATIIRWLKNPGDPIEADEAILEIATDKVDSEVPSPVSGRLSEQLFKENDVVQVGAVIATIDTSVPEAPKPAPTQAPQPVSAPAPTPAPQPVAQPVYQAPAPVLEKAPATAQAIPGVDQLNKPAPAPQPVVAVATEGRFYSPLVKNIAQQEGISVAELDRIPGSGTDGRLTKDDLLAYITNRPAAQANRAPQPVAVPQQAAAQPTSTAQQPHAAPPSQPAQTASQPQTAAPQQQAPAAPKPVYSVSGGDEIIEMDRMRKLIADHMVMSKHTSPHVTSFVEADVTNIVNWREKVKKGFEQRTGERLTFTPIFTEAVVKAIKDFPLINSSVNGSQIIKKKDINIGMATALPSGNLIVPVIHKADTLNLVGLTKSVNDLATRARANKLVPDEVKNGTFTITNVGSFGNVMGTPIINQPQVAILAVGVIKKKPAVLETKDGDVIAIRHMMFLSLSYDHRVIDGSLGGSFIRRVADHLENWDVNREV
ncbi:dihydrolipoamide acetyltransferase family protein [Mucilaginibacter myungsuensis]|uniref:Dihydrolipoamide acetyltransferase component of pyruvate dehydrogenase complex n=1 Tax=Mucilaginibacter myungsuensis TaxID=649104 RepID=A0A929KSG9_9SPHI|nr:dihydrolipoamide acetyltransferase family protein [Mucilaginibacter myungsuensis]MBE9660342.1 2-oxo acid dehydrogenase subunit E2 [Mucilaginibacter myungsuensis]MDN3600384.1 dihydrolipoamide acetyltransferase family protein [Mucilaginibacter myungsuensis]